MFRGWKVFKKKNRKTKKYDFLKNIFGCNEKDEKKNIKERSENISQKIIHSFFEIKTRKV